MPTVMPNTPNALVGGGVANTDFDDFTNPTASNFLNDASVPHALQHSNKNDAIERIERWVLARSPRVVKGSTTSVTGAGTGFQTLFSWTIPGVASTGWMTTNTAIHVVAAGTIDVSASGLGGWSFRLAVGATATPTVLSSGINLGTPVPYVGGVPTAPVAGGATVIGTPPQYEWDFDGWVICNDAATPGAMQLRTQVRLATDLVGGAAPSGIAQTYMDSKSGAVIVFNNTVNSAFGLTVTVPTGGTPANNVCRITSGIISLESI